MHGWLFNKKSITIHGNMNVKLCGICFVTLRKDCSLQVSENTVLRRMYEPKRREMRRLEKLLHIFNIFLIFDALDNYQEQQNAFIVSLHTLSSHTYYLLHVLTISGPS